MPVLTCGSNLVSLLVDLFFSAVALWRVFLFPEMLLQKMQRWWWWTVQTTVDESALLSVWNITARALILSLFLPFPLQCFPTLFISGLLFFLCVSGSRWTGWRCPGQTYASAATEWLNMRETNTTSPTHRGTASVSGAAPRLRVPIDPRRCCLTITQMILAVVSIPGGESFDYAALQRVHYQSHALNISVSHREKWWNMLGRRPALKYKPVCDHFIKALIICLGSHVPQFIIPGWRWNPPNMWCDGVTLELYFRRTCWFLWL